MAPGGYMSSYLWARELSQKQHGLAMATPRVPSPANLRLHRKLRTDELVQFL
jgi:hypothetical protein